MGDAGGYESAGAGARLGAVWSESKLGRRRKSSDEHMDARPSKDASEQTMRARKSSIALNGEFIVLMELKLLWSTS